MTIIIIILILLFVLLLGLLIAPMQLYIDTPRQVFSLRWSKLLETRLIGVDDIPKIQLQIFFWRKEWDVFQLLSSSQKQRKKPSTASQKKPKKRSNRFFRMSYKTMFRKAKQVLRSFEVKQCDVRLDTDDFVRNSYLYPIFYMLNGKNRKLSINYQGEASVQLLVQNRLYRIIAAVLF